MFWVMAEGVGEEGAEGISSSPSVHYEQKVHSGTVTVPL